MVNASLMAHSASHVTPRKRVQHLVLQEADGAAACGLPVPSRSYHGVVWEIGVLLLLVAILAVFLAPRFIRRGPRAEALSGTLLVTGVSPRPDATGEQYVTITGVIDGPTVNEHNVYQRMAVNVDNWPKVGELMPVVYSQKNPDNWAFAPPERPPG
jgi:hypothetical protein